MCRFLVPIFVIFKLQWNIILLETKFTLDVSRTAIRSRSEENNGTTVKPNTKTQLGSLRHQT